MKQFEYLGYGLGLRTVHYDDILNTKPEIDWFEILTENYLVPGGNPNYYLEKIRQDYPMVMHGVSLSIGSIDPIDWDYVQQVKNLADRIEAKWVSDHLCWTGINGINLHDLMPIPYTEEALQHIVNRVKQVQDFMGRQILLENPSTYVTFKQSNITEWDFLVELCKQADCYLLLDVNNIYVSAFNHRFDPQEYINAIPKERVVQIHMAGHENCDTHIIDTHDHEIISDVWNLYADTIKRFGKVSTMIERDDHIPPLKDLLAELEHAKEIAENIHEKADI